MKNLAKLTLGLTMVLNCLNHAAAGDPSPNLEIESTIKKLNGGDFKFHSAEGLYRFAWKDDDGTIRYASWYVQGSQLVAKLEAKSTVLFMEIYLAPATDVSRIQASIEKETGLKTIPVSHENQKAVVFKIALDKIPNDSELKTMAKRTRAVVESAMKGSDPKREKETALLRLRSEERKLSSNIDYCEKQRAFWQRKYDESISPDPNKLPNFQAFHYANKWENDTRNAENRLSLVQELIAEWEAK